MRNSTAGSVGIPVVHGREDVNKLERHTRIHAARIKVPVLTVPPPSSPIEYLEIAA